MNYPNKCLRGLSSKEVLIDDNRVASTFFTFEDRKSKDDNERSDGMIEESINWMDYEGAVTFTLEQTKPDGSKQFKCGVAIIDREKVDMLNNSHNMRGDLYYERSPIEGNEIHGNMLIRKSNSKQVKRLVGAMLALCVIQVIPQPE